MSSDRLTLSEDLELQEEMRVEKGIGRAENAMFLGLGLFLATGLISFTSDVTAWFLTGGFAIVAFVAALGFLVGSRR